MEIEETPAVDQMAVEKKVYDELTAPVEPETQVQPEEAAAEPETADKSPELLTDVERRLGYDNLTPAAVKLLRDGLSEAELLEMDAHRARRHGRVDSVYHERNKLERALAELRQAQSDPVEPQPEKSDLVSRLGEHADQLAPGVVEALQAYVDEKVSSVTPAPEPQVAAGPSQEDRGRMDAQIEATRARLQDMYPGARLDGDSPEWDAIVRQAEAIGRSGVRDTSTFEATMEAVPSLFDMAMHNSYGLPQAPVQETTTPSGPVVRNTAASSPSIQKPVAEMSEREQAQIMHSHMKRHPGDMNGARKLVGLPPLNLSSRTKRN